MANETDNDHEDRSSRTVRGGGPAVLDMRSVSATEGGGGPRRPAPAAFDSDVVIGVTTGRAAKITGVSVSRIAAWERIGLIIPEATQRVAGRTVRVFGVGDLVELGVVRELQARGAPLPTIRRVVEAHRNSTAAQPLRELSWATHGGKVFVGFPDGSWVGGKAPMQGVLTETINLERIRISVARKAVERSAPDVGRIERRSRTMGRKPVFAGTRIPVDMVLSYLRDGAGDEEILEAYPQLGHEDLVAARQQLATA